MPKWMLHIEDENGITIMHEEREAASFDVLMDQLAAETWTQNHQLVELRRTE